MIKYINLVFIFILGFLLTGCACIPGGITSSTTPLHGRSYNVVGPTAATDSRFALFGVIPISRSNNIQDAVDKAKQNVTADALIDVTVDSYTQWFILFTRTVTRVNGQGIRFKEKWEGDIDVVR